MVSSTVVAELFEKEHKNVLAAIRDIECEDETELGRLNFQPTSHTDQWNREQPAYSLTRDGFMLLTLGFTGKKALAWRWRVIEAFNAMEMKIITFERAGLKSASGDGTAYQGFREGWNVKSG